MRRRICVRAARTRSRLRWLVTGSDSRARTRWRSPRCCWSRCGSARRVRDRPRRPTHPRHGRSGELARYALTGPLEGFDAVLVELNFQPGASVPEHRHPGPILGYVVDGQMRTAIDHEPDEIVPAGGTFFEPHGALHTSFGSANPDAPVRIVAFLVVPNGSPLTERAASTERNAQAPAGDADALHGHPPAGVRGGVGGHVPSGRRHSARCHEWQRRQGVPSGRPRAAWRGVRRRAGRSNLGDLVRSL